MLTHYKPTKTGIRITELLPRGRRKLLGTIRREKGEAALHLFVAAHPLTAAQLDTVQVIMAG